MILLAAGYAPAQVRYNLLPYPVNLGITSANNLNINNQGVIVGTTHAFPAETGFVWKNNKVKPLPSLGGTCTIAAAISDTQHVSGTSCVAGDAAEHATLWRQMQPIDLDTFGGTASFGGAINRFDEVAGGYTLSDGSLIAFFWSNGEWQDIGTLGGSFTFTGAINDAGTLAGQSDISNIPDPVFGIPPFHSFIWSTGVLTDLGQVLGSDFNSAADIDAKGKVAGTSDLAGDIVAHAYLWQAGTVRDLGTLPGDAVSWGMAMNNLGQVVGASGQRDPNLGDGPPVYVMLCPCSAVLWQNGNTLDLNTAVPSEWSLEWASAINDKGEILARAYSTSGFDGMAVLRPLAGASPAEASANPRPQRLSQGAMSHPGARKLFRNGYPTSGGRTIHEE
jgi:probable HAF family extracellular repeat protein